MATSTKKKEASPQLLTPEFRVSFPTVFEAKAIQEGQKKKYSVQMLFSKKTDITVLKQAVHAEIVKKWGADSTKWPAGLRNPIRDGSEKQYDGYGPDVVFATASSMNRPGLVDQNVQPIISPEEFYGGCYARATVRPFAYDKMGNKGVSFGLANIQKIRDGEKFSGATNPENDFDAIPVPQGNAAEGAGSDAATDSDPLAGLK